MKLIIPGTLPGTNEILNASNNNRHVYNELKRNYTHLVAICAKQAKLPELPPADYTITWYCPDRRKDKDNVMGGQKFIFDGLVQAGRLQNDGWNDIGDITHRFRVDKVAPRIEIEITEVSA
ncbi:Holliday junction resolvase [Paenibacillus filicis]|uniref:Holliday junction resolvase n=1 Tax=Paenibacillus filicis TaxID=669464 RepID=A0ABU9DHN6_9BACL